MFTAGGKYNKFATETYSWKFENYLFQQENINYISNHKALKEQKKIDMMFEKCKCNVNKNLQHLFFTLN